MTYENYRSSENQIANSHRFARDKDQIPDPCDKIQAESDQISRGQDRIINKIIPVIQIQTELDVSVIAEDHQKDQCKCRCRSENASQRSLSHRPGYEKRNDRAD